MNIWWECIRKTLGTWSAFKTWWLLLVIVNTFGDVQRCLGVLSPPSTCSQFYTFWPLPGLHYSCSLFRFLLVFAIPLFSAFKNIYLSYPKQKVYLLCFTVQLEIGKIPLHVFRYSTYPPPTTTLSTVDYWFRDKEILWSLMNYCSWYWWSIPSVT